MVEVFLHVFMAWRLTNQAQGRFYHFYVLDQIIFQYISNMKLILSNSAPFQQFILNIVNFIVSLRNVTLLCTKPKKKKTVCLVSFHVTNLINAKS